MAAFAPATAVAHPCATAAQTFLTLNGGAAWSGLPALDEETDCAIIDQSGLTVADTTVAAASAVPDAVSSYVWSPNMTPLGHHARNVPFTGTGSTVFNSDLAFQGNLAFQGTYDGYRVLDVSDPANPTQIVNYTGCGGTLGQGDVVVWGSILIRSWDVPVSAGQAATTMCAGQLVGQGFEGIHIFDISNPASPVLLKQLRMANTGNDAGAPAGCGSHTDTIVPDAARGNLYLYIGGSSGACTGMDIVRVNIANPADAVYLRRAAAGRQCHDNNVIMGTVNLAMCAGGNGLSVFKFDPSIDPAAAGGLENPTLLWNKPITGVTTGHSGSFTFDGKILVFGHEPGGGSQAQCQSGSSLVNRSIYFFNPQNGDQLGTFTHQRPQTNRENCTWHNFNVVPTYRGYVYVSGNYQSGISVVDFTNPAAAREVAFADPAPLSPTSLVLGGDWSTYWHNGKIYESDIRRGLTTWDLDDSLTNRHLNFDRSNPQTQTLTFDPDFDAPAIQIDSPVDGSEHAVNSVVQAGLRLHRLELRRRVVRRHRRRRLARRHQHHRRPHVHRDGDRQGRQRQHQDGHLPRAPHDRGRHRQRHGAGHAVADGRPPATFGAFTPGVARDYFATTTANVISTAGDASLSVADPSSTATGHLVNGAFSTPAALQARARNAANPATAYANVGSIGEPAEPAELRRADLERPRVARLQADDRRERRAADGHVQQDADVHPVHHHPVALSAGRRTARRPASAQRYAWLRGAVRDQAPDAVEHPLDAEGQVRLDALVREDARVERAAERGEALGVDQRGDQHRRLRRLGAELTRKPRLPHHRAVEQEHGRGLLRLGEVRVGERVQAAVQPGELARGHRRAADRQVQHPRMVLERHEQFAAPALEAFAPAGERRVERHRRLGRRVEHQREQIVLALDVAVERHRGESEPFRDAAHRHCVEAVGIGEFHGCTDDPVEA